nr:uncharacterized protein LOC113802824 isoform X2 [Penaeus vannamei]
MKRARNGAAEGDVEESRGHVRIPRRRRRLRETQVWLRIPLVPRRERRGRRPGRPAGLAGGSAARGGRGGRHQISSDGRHRRRYGGAGAVLRAVRGAAPASHERPGALKEEDPPPHAAEVSQHEAHQRPPELHAAVGAQHTLRELALSC